MKKMTAVVSMLVLTSTLLFGCSSNGGEQQETETPQTTQTTQEADGEEQTDPEVSDEAGKPQEPALADGVYTAEFHTDSSMFHVNEACDGKGTLTVKDGEMVIHISLTSKNIVNLYPGLAEDAQKEGAQLLEPTVDTVTYDDGMSEEVNGFDIPVPVLDEEFDVALVGTKGTWYDHKVSVTNVTPAGDDAADQKNAAAGQLEDGSYTINVTFEGGSGRAYIESPATITVAGDRITATVTWSSPNYDYMLVDGEKYLPVNTEGNSVFEIPVAALDIPVTVIGDTIAMSTPHEIEYTLTFLSDTAKTEE